MSKICILVGPSGSGKTTIAEAIIKKTNFSKITTCTTRKPRDKEINGVDYHFLSKEEMQEQIKLGAFVEHSRYAGEIYGTRYKELTEAIKNGQNVIIVMDIKGAKAIRKQYPKNSVSIYLDRTKYDLVMAILERNISNAEKASRIIQLNEDEKAKDKCDYVVENHELHRAILEVKSILLEN